MKIFQIGNLPESLYAQIGGKAKGLDFLRKNGFRVPEGFVVAETEALTEEDFAEMVRAFRELNVRKVSVRSSASNEDGGEFSNAGQYETCLNVTEEHFKDAVERCLASLRGARAAAYAEKLLKEKDARMNLVVQRMVEAKFAGVLFTADPVNREEMLIESVDGMGENLVSGAVSAHRYSISKRAFFYGGGGNLNESLLHKLYEEGQAIAKAYGAEADLEWVIDENDELYWLQLRPITTLEEADLDEFDPANPLDDHLLTSRNIGEMMPGAVTPLSISTSVLAIDYGIRNMLYQIGAIKSVSARPDYYTALAYKNHLFIDMTALHSMSKRVIMASPAAMNLSIMGEYLEDFPKVEGKNAFFLTKLFNGIKFAKYLFSSQKAKEKIVKLNEELQFCQNGSPDEVYREISEKLHVMNEALCCHYVCSSFSGAMNSALYMTLADDFEDKAEYQAFISNILSDIDGIESADILASLKHLAAVIDRENPDAVSLSEEQLLDYVTDESHTEANALYREFLQKHGHRSIKEAELRSKAWKNDQKALIKNLHTVLLSGDYREKEKKPFHIEDYLTNFKGGKRKALKWIGPNARKAVVDREFSKSNIIKIIDRFKDRYALLSEMLEREGYLADRDSIYFLTHEEIGRLLQGESALKRKALSRRAVFREAENLTFHDVCIGQPQSVEPDGVGNAEGLKGIPVCKGRVYGKARVVRTAEDAALLEKGEIMVAPFTDIGWSPYYSLVGALVTEVGSALSHGAVVAREYCLPTVVNVKNATKLVKTGDYLYVDAYSGVVRVVSEKESIQLRRES